MDEMTEVMTPQGWKRVKDFKDGQQIEVLVFNPNFNSAGVEINTVMLVENNKTYYFDNTDKLNIKTAGKLLIYKGQGAQTKTCLMEGCDFVRDTGMATHYYKVKTCWMLNKNDETDFTDDDIALMAMVKCCNAFIKEYPENDWAEMTLTKKTDVSRAVNLLRKMNIKFRYAKREDGRTFMAFRIPKGAGDLQQYYKADRKRLETLFRECFEWNGKKEFRTFKKSDADVIQYALACNDLHSRIETFNPKDKSYKKTYAVKPDTTKCVSISKEPETVKGKTNEYVFSSSSGLIITRRRDCIAIIGCAKK